jgi:hypothetical protein
VERGERVGTGVGSKRRSAMWAAAAIVGSCLQATIARSDVVTRSPGVQVEGVKAATSLALSRMAPGVHEPAPEPGLDPDAVVGIVLRALQHNDDPVVDHGIAVTFAFTSPENHDVTGPIDRFRALVKSSTYRPMIGHARADRGPLVVLAAHARERVAITGAHGERATYLFLLSRQETGVYKGCWMADGVLREEDAILDPAPKALVRAVALHTD